MRMPKRVSSIAVALASAFVVAAFSAQAQAYSALYAFGDSLSDVGNVYLGSGGALPAAPYVAGRFTNGPTWIDGVSSKLGLGPVLPSLAGGNDFAFGGAVTGPAVPGGSTAVLNVVQQVGLFSLAHGGSAPSGALYSFWIGSNDVLNALDGIQSSTLTVPQAEADLTTAAQTAAGALSLLASEGATHLLVGLVPDLGLTPRYNSTASALATSLSAAYNAALVGSIGALLPAAPVTYFDTFKLLDTAAADPGAFGLSNVTGACYRGPFTGGGSVCADPAQYLFWDDIHPTTIGHQAIAALALSALSGAVVTPVPLPPGFALYGASLIILAVLTRRSRVKRAGSAGDVDVMSHHSAPAQRSA